MREAIILAAGFGTRLRPITEIIPKAIFPILEKPLIVWQIEKMKEKGFERFYVNLHYLSDKVVKVIEDYGLSKEVVFQFENPILLTGGGLRGLLNTVKGEDILVHNVDILEEFNIENLFRVHEEMQNDVTWGLVKEKGNVRVDGERIVNIGEDGFAFTGVAVYKKRIISLMPSGRFNLIPWIVERLKKERLKIGYVFLNGFWVDMGTPHGVFMAYRHLLRNNVMVMGQIEGNWKFRGIVYVGKDVKVKGEGTIEDSVLLGNTTVNGGFNIKRSIIYDNRQITF